MVLSTPVQITESERKISYNDRIISLGSCFAENIGSKLQNACFSINVNPFGIQFNPASIARNLNRLLEGFPFSEEDLKIHNDLWFSFSHSTLFSGEDKDYVLKGMNKRFTEASDDLSKLTYLFITWGTSWVYEHVENSEVVNNCHKLDAKLFRKFRLEPDSIVKDYEKIFEKLYEINPDLRIVLSVSPVRHWKDGAHENTLSKSVLHLASSMLEEKFKNVSYFPSYEILMDELRDYRYFADDMCHPTDLAVNYIWEKFSYSYFTSETMNIMREIEKYSSRLFHRSIHQGSVEDLSFKEKTQEIKLSLGLKYPFLKDKL